VSIPPDRFEQASELLIQVLSLAPESRLDFLRSQCGSDAELLTFAKSLLRGHEEAEDFLDQPPSLLAADFLDSADEAPPVLVAERYLLMDEIGRGGSGTVWRATDQRINDREVAIKILHSHWSRNTWMRFRLQDEMRALSKLHHPSIVSVLDFGELQDGRAFLVMELVRGGTLREHLSAGRLPVEQSLAIATRLAEGLDAAHENGILHRDLKPENIILRSDGGVKIVDFGIARIVEPDAALRSTTAFVAGTPAYMAPDQLRGHASRASDVWSLAVIAFEMLTGTRPFQPATPFELADLHRKGLSNQFFRGIDPRLPAPAEELFRNALSERSSGREETASAFSAALKRTMDSAGSFRGRFSRREIGGLAASALAATAGGWFAGERYFGWGALSESERVMEWVGGVGEPVSVGFARILDVRNDPILSPDRSVRDRVRLFTRDQGMYLKETSVRQRSTAWRRGWRLQARLAPEQGMTWVTVNLYRVGARYDLLASRDSEGKLMVGLGRQASPQLLWDKYEAQLQPDGLIHAEMRCAPDHKADLYINGTLRASGHEGHHQYQLNETLPQCGLCFGVSAQPGPEGSGVLQFVRFEIAS